MNETLLEFIKSGLPLISHNLAVEMAKIGVVKEVPANSEIMREGQYVKVVPLLIQGLIKVYTRYKEKELLLYYIKPNESCVMSFSSGLSNHPSPIYAITEEKSTIVALPVSTVNSWVKEFPDINTLFYNQYNQRYIDLLDTINHLVYDKMDQRLFSFLKEKAELTQKNPLTMSHRQIAQELGTAREVISRIMKKLEHEGFVKQMGKSINILSSD